MRSEPPPLLIKGACHILTGLWPTFGSRVLRDIDLVLPEPALLTAFNQLSRLAGCAKADPGARELVALSKHCDRLIGPGLSLPVELHHSVLPPETSGVLSTERLLARAVPAGFRGANFLVPAPTDQVLIAIIHGPLGGGTYLAPEMHLRDCLDVVFLMRKHGDAIDWGGIEAGLRSQRCSVVLEILRLCMRRFVGVDLPVPRQGWMARADARRWEWQLERAWSVRLGRLANLSALAIRHLKAGGVPRRRALGYLRRRETYLRNARRVLIGDEP